MNLHRYQLKDTVYKAVEDVTLWQTEKGLVKIKKDTLGLPVELDGHHNGYVFQGHGTLTLDAIVETERGAIGKPVEKEIRRPFLMLGPLDALQHSFDKAEEDDVKKAGCENAQAFVHAAEAFFDEFLGTKRFCGYGSLEIGEGFLFVIPAETGRSDILLAKGSKLVYKATGMAFISSRHKTILKDRGSVALSRNGKSFIFKTAASP